MKLSIDVDNASGAADTPEEPDMQLWLGALFAELASSAPRNVEISIRLVNRAESRQLNYDYRHQDNATNVLSFPSDFPPELDIPLLGDLAICANVVEQEALTQHKTARAHWAHMVIHGTLHLLGYDHIDDREADVMEALETKIITGLGFPPPYQDPTPNGDNNH